MAFAPVTSAGLETSPAPLPFNRRVSVRYSAGAVLSATMCEGSCYLFRRVRVHNISTGGIALMLKYPPAKGTEVSIRISNRLLNFTYDLLAVALHVAEQQDGKWLVGFSFTRELTLGELASLL